MKHVRVISTRCAPLHTNVVVANIFFTSFGSVRNVMIFSHDVTNYGLFVLNVKTAKVHHIYYMSVFSNSAVGCLLGVTL